MGGKMNLNPLKKDDNTDALVQALEDANNVGAMQPGVTPGAVPDSATIAADPQVASAGVVDPVVTSDTTDTSTAVADDSVESVDPSATADTQAAVDSLVMPDTTDANTNTTASDVDFDSNDLPDGLSSDADAHLTDNMPSEGTGEDGELDNVKKDALEQLRPLIEKLDLEPADKFDKYLMMLRASDDPALIKPAFDAAQGISGEKEKAQALLDIINEINYITASKQNA